MKTSLLIIVVFIAVAALSLLTGCRTEYYEPKGKTFTKVDKKIYGPVKSEGVIVWSNGVGKNLPLANPSFSVVGK
ncbi:MAG: hypothetical protein KAS17_07710 [Victivallaceae bacterium]|nr:hypothetical protein [Victivallaceae bacterium]